MVAATKRIRFLIQRTQAIQKVIHAPIVAARIGNLTTLIPGFVWDANVSFLPKHINATIQIVGSTYFWTTTVNNTNQTIDVASEYSI